MSLAHAITEQVFSIYVGQQKYEFSLVKSYFKSSTVFIIAHGVERPLGEL
jgi:hypothetical protein